MTRVSTESLPTNILPESAILFDSAFWSQMRILNLILLTCHVDVAFLFLSARLSVDNITEEVKTLKGKLKELEKGLKKGPKDISSQFSEFVQVS